MKTLKIQRFSHSKPFNRKNPSYNQVKLFDCDVDAISVKRAFNPAIASLEQLLYFIKTEYSALKYDVQILLLARTDKDLIPLPAARVHQDWLFTFFYHLWARKDQIQGQKTPIRILLLADNET